MALISMTSSKYEELNPNCNGCIDEVLALQYLKGKKLCLVGGHESADSIHSRFFERFDIVIQLNHHILRRPQQPLDWWICRSSPPIEFSDLERLEKEPKIISTAVNTHKFPEFVQTAQAAGICFIPFHENCFIKANPFHYTLEWCNAFWHEMDTNPFIGTLALRMALNHPIKSIFLTGFDFFTQKDNKIKDRVGVHDTETQTNWFKKMWNTDFRVSFDNRLIECLKLDTTRRGITPSREIKNAIPTPKPFLGDDKND